MEFINEYVDKMKNIQIFLLEYLEKEDIEEADFQNMIQYFDKQNVLKNKNDFRILLSTISEITSNHHFTYDFFTKIEQILNALQDNLKSTFTNYELFHIFKNSKRILLYLYDSKMIIPERSFIQYDENMYFFPEYSPFYEQRTKEEHQVHHPSDYQQIRKEGKDNQYICQLIQKDSIEEFITLVNKESISLSNTKIKPSIYETNPFLNGKELTIIQYASFFGSIQIFNYLILNKIELKPSLWPYVIHGNNSEIFSILEENKIEPFDDFYDECYLEAVNCYHIDFMNYIKTNYSTKIKDTSILSELKSNNFIDFSDKVNDVIDLFKNENKELNIRKLHLLEKFIENDCFEIFNFLLKNIKINLNEYIWKSEYGTDYLGNIHDDNSTKQIKKTLLHIAVEKGNVEIAQLLINNKDVDINQKDLFSYNSLYYSETVKQTSLHIAVEKADLKMVQALLAREDIDVNEVQFFNVTSTNSEKTALYLAVENGYEEIVNLLLTNKNIDVNFEAIGYYLRGNSWISNVYTKQLYSKKTSLHKAVENGNFEITRHLLLHKNIITDKKDLKGRTPLELAKNEEIKKLFAQ